MYIWEERKLEQEAEQGRELRGCEGWRREGIFMQQESERTYRRKEIKIWI